MQPIIGLGPMVLIFARAVIHFNGELGVFSSQAGFDNHDVSLVVAAENGPLRPTPVPILPNPVNGFRPAVRIV